jgi:hypothetical protein
VISRRFTVWQKLTALAPLFLLVVAGPGQELLRCQIDGLLRTSCCCPADQESESDSSTAVVKTQGCCDRSAAAAADHSPAETTTTAHDRFGWTSFQALAAPAVLSLAHSDRAIPLRQSHWPRRDGPSVLLLKNAFLI